MSSTTISHIRKKELHTWSLDTDPINLPTTNLTVDGK